MSKSEVLRLARRYRVPVVLVESPQPSAELAGYVRVIDLGLSQSDEIGPLRPLLEIAEDTSHVAALTRMQSTQEELARVVDLEGETLGIVTTEELREMLFRGGH